MRDVLGPGTVLGYCTNVHGGDCWSELRANLSHYALRVRELTTPGESLPVGVWMSASGWSEASAREAAVWMHVCGLFGFTLNAFPQIDFHQPVVKRRVYTPGWDKPERREYTERCISAISPICVLEDTDALSVSTVPIGWPGMADPVAAGRQLRELIQVLRKSASCGYSFTVDLEPEPGCILDTADDVLRFFDEHLPDEIHRRHIGICHDICHAAVMFEDQVEVLRKYAEAGIRVNKVQISSCPRVAGRSHCSQSSGTQRQDGAAQAAALAELRKFVEPRYLHQTMVRAEDGSQRFFEDLPEAFGALDAERPGSASRATTVKAPGSASRATVKAPASASRATMGDGEWRTHFHVPVYLDRIGEHLLTTRDQIMPAIQAAREYHDTKFFEVETYAWGVLPGSALEPAWRGRPQEEWLAEGIARELLWVKGEAERVGVK